jgi:hypothetical protein
VENVAALIASLEYHASVTPNDREKLVYKTIIARLRVALRASQARVEQR